MTASHRTRGTAAALIAALVAVSLPAAAQPAPAAPRPNEAQMTQAKDLVNKAIAKSQAGDHGAAIELYLQAYNIAPLPLLLSNLGSEYQQAQKPVEALKFFCKYLEAEPTGPNASFATAQAKVLQTQLGNPVDDASVCKPLPVAPAAPPLPPPSPSPTPPPPSGVPAPDDPGRGLRLTGLGVGAIGVAAAVVGVIYGRKAQTISDSITNHPTTEPWPDNIQSQESEGKSDQTKQIAFLVGGGVAIVAGVAIYVVGHKKTYAAEHPNVALVPTAAPGFGGLALVGGW